jgi:6-phosphogluconolactonase/glucosamine-6-phosphate isomerase/deaminase
MPTSLKFVKIIEPKLAADFIAERIIDLLRTGQQVLWLVPGGSAINVAVLAAEQIAQEPHANLVATLTDERYGEVNHADSNWRQLLAAGFYLPQAKLMPVLTGLDRLATVENWINNLEREFSQADYVLGLFGLGADGHTAGILPHSPAVSARELVSTYDADKFQRVTITPAAIIKLNEAIVWAQGVDKWPALAQLDQLVSLAEEPAQILKKLERLTIFTDYQVVK